MTENDRDLQKTKRVEAYYNDTASIWRSGAAAGGASLALSIITREGHSNAYHFAPKYNHLLV